MSRVGVMADHFVRRDVWSDVDSTSDQRLVSQNELWCGGTILGYTVFTTQE